MTTTTPRASIQIAAVPPGQLDRIRAQGHDDHGNPFVERVDPDGGAPLRCCLRDSRPGEQIALIAYRPVRVPGPYAEVGPIFVHADACRGYPDGAGYPDDFRRRPQVFRTYRADGSIAGGRLVESGDGQEHAAEALLADPEVEVVHSRNVVHGCFMFEISRAAGDRGQAGSV